MKRRKAIQRFAQGIGIGSLLPSVSLGINGINDMIQPHENRIKHSVCRWCYDDIPLEEFCEAAQDLGIQSIELTTPEQWPILQKYKLTCAMGTHGEVSLTEGFNHTENHPLLHRQYLKLIDQAADAGLSNVIVFSGNRKGLSEEEGLENSAKGLQKVVRHAQKRGITIMMEIIKSKIAQQGYQCDNTTWGVAIAEKIGLDT